MLYLQRNLMVVLRDRSYNSCPFYHLSPMAVLQTDVLQTRRLEKVDCDHELQSKARAAIYKRS